ncbi:hypothetical protein [Persephonella sp.]|jgi:type II secretory pathway pseudopilin PulG
MRTDEKGAALLTTLILGLVALAVIGALMTFILFGKKTSISERKYTSALEAAKGVSDFIMRGLLDAQLICTSSDGSVSCNCDDLLASPLLKCPSCTGSSCPEAKYLSLGAYSSIGNYNLSAEVLSKVETPNEVVYGIRVQASGQNSGEKAIVEFVYKLE